MMTQIVERGMILTVEQQRAIESGQAVAVVVAGKPCVVVRKDVYDRGEVLDYGPCTPEEIDLLAAETVDLLAGDGFDESGKRWREEWQFEGRTGIIPLRSRFPFALERAPDAAKCLSY